jgi:meiotic recombination protein SPO11
MCETDDDVAELKLELQIMMVMGVKTEIQWLDEAGNLCEWLDERIGSMLSSGQ